MKNIVLFASGAGSNAENIIKYFEQSTTINVCHIFCNNPHAGVILKAQNLGVNVTIFEKHEFSTTVLQDLHTLKPDLIVLAGFLLKFPTEIIQEFPDKIINIHPALLPKYGGKGMYGMHVHNAILENGDQKTGISVHYVNENYDEGSIILQSEVDISACPTADEIAQKVHQLEHAHFPTVIENLLS